ncbi:MAG: 6-carboxytetrahydropterin synthase [Candidatus Neomarinimicrobiota bacterium]
MFSVTVRDQMLVAHSLKGQVFGKARNLHGATYVVEAEFKRSELDENNTVIDMALASKILREVISPLDYQNLDDLDQFRSQTTTAEFLASYIHDEMVGRTRLHFDGRLKITLRESSQTWASFEGEVK